MSAALARTQDVQFDAEQIQLLKNTIAKGASDAEFGLFAQTCKRLQLDPFARQIFLVPRYDTELGGTVRQAQVSIDGFRLVAERTREYRGQTAAEWCGPDGKWLDVWLLDEPPAAARVGVHREGFKEPMVRVATYKSYVQTKKNNEPTKTWRTMPDVMLAKCAEALALRAAFPHELSGVYTSEEMGQVDNDEPARPLDATPKLPRSSGSSSAQTSTSSASGLSERDARESHMLNAVRTLHKELLTAERMADFRLHARGVFDQLRVPRDKRQEFWGAWAKRCEELGLIPQDVAAEADGRAA